MQDIQVITDLIYKFALTIKLKIASCTSFAELNENIQAQFAESSINTIPKKLLNLKFAIYLSFLVSLI